ncbi:MAG: hypothetical protein NC548_31000, partial [Lachnospiraceae bacterium]|nr:hypothetical protein [Lachnospiraceae bacterium]
RLFTSVRNGNSLFFPASGYCNVSGLVSAGSYGCCWSSAPYSSGSFVCNLYFYSGHVYYMDISNRFCGLPVRGVFCE